MNFFEVILRFLDSSMEKPTMYGWFHLLCIFIMFAAAFVLCLLWKKGVIKDVQRVVLVTSIIVIICEIYKQINHCFDYEGGITFEINWRVFPWQFCSTPMFVGLLAGLTKGKINKNLSAYLATYAFFAGLAVMLYPSTVFSKTIGTNIQTMVCHGSMVTIAIFLYYTKYVEASYKTTLYAMPVFAVNMGIAITLNELAHLVGITENYKFNMFFISRYFDSEIIVHNLIHDALRGSFFGWLLSTVLYFIGFSACAFIISLIPIGIKKFLETDFEALYAEKNALREERRLAKEAEIAQLDAEIDVAEAARLEKLRLKKEKREAKLAKKKAKKEKQKLEKEKKRLAKLEAEKREKEEKKKRKKEEKKRAEKKKKEKKKAEKKRKKKEKKLKKKEKKLKKKEKREKAKQKRKEKKEKRRLKLEKKKEKLRLKLDKKARLRAEKEERARLIAERKARIADDVKFFFDMGYTEEELNEIYSVRKNEFKISDKKLEKVKSKLESEAEKQEKRNRKE